MKSRLFGLASKFERYNYAAVPEIASDTRNMLINEHYAKDVERLEKILGRDLSHWIEP